MAFKELKCQGHEELQDVSRHLEERMQCLTHERCTCMLHSLSKVSSIEGV